MSHKLANAPIFYTLGQIKFNPVLDMNDYVGAFQKRWRSRYPDFSVQELNQFQVQMRPSGQAPAMKTASTQKWHFKNTEQTSGIVLSTDSVVFHTTDYSTSENFFRPLMESLGVVHETVTLAYVESVALRTLDAVIPDDKHDFSFFLNNRLLGLSSQLEGTMKHSLLELVQNRVDGQLTTRVAFLPGQIGIPMDLVPITLLLPAKVRQLNTVHAILDNDCVQRKRFHFDLPKVEESLKNVKSGITEAFKKSVTANALEHWS